MRVSRATDLVHDGIEANVAAEWMGHTNEIADAHYRMVHDGHKEKALKETGFDFTKTVQPTVQFDGHRCRIAIPSSMVPYFLLPKSLQKLGADVLGVRNQILPS